MYVIIRLRGAGIDEANGPTRLHNDRSKAIAEAERLAAKHPGCEFVLFEGLEKVSCSISPVVWNDIIDPEDDLLGE